MIDNVYIKLKIKCPACGRTGTAIVPEASELAYMRGDTDVSVYVMPEGFAAVSRKTDAFNSSFDVDWVEHNVSAIGYTV